MGIINIEYQSRETDVAKVVGADDLDIEDVDLDEVANTTDTGLLTYLARALFDVGEDELVVRMTDGTASIVDPRGAVDSGGSQVDRKAYGGNAAHSSVSLGTADTQLLTATTDRRNFTVMNNGSDIVFIELGGNAADTADGLPIPSGESYTDQEFTGEVRGIANSGTQDVRIVEVSK